MAPTEFEPKMQSMQSAPFDGLVFKLSPYEIDNQYIFSGYQIDYARNEAQIDALQRMDWGQFTDNFLLISTGKNSIDWFSDAEWNNLTQNVAFAARAAKLGGCKGIFIDPEQYSTTEFPWNYPSQKYAKRKTFSQYNYQMEKRGEQFIKTIEDNFGGPVNIINAFMINDSYYNGTLKPGVPNDARNLTTNWQGLLPAFMAGMVNGASDGTVITDGNETSYYYIDPEQFRIAKGWIQGVNANYTPFMNKYKYWDHVEAAQAVYPNYLLGPMPTNFFMPTYCNKLNRSSKLAWLEHNVYYAMKYSNKYTWFYGEPGFNWQVDQIPDDVTHAIADAKSKLSQNLPIGVNLSPILFPR